MEKRPPTMPGEVSQDLIDMANDVMAYMDDPAGYIEALYPGAMEQYRTGNSLKRAIIAKRYPQVAQTYAYLEAQASVVNARRHAETHEGNIYII